MNTKTPSILVALAGGSGSGKSSLAVCLRREFGAEATSISLDDFYRDLSHLRLSERERINFDHPDSIDWPLFEGVLSQLRNGVTSLAPRYDFGSHTRLSKWEPRRPRPFIFVEGLWPWRSPRVKGLFDLRVFLDCAEWLRWKRRLARDGTERSRASDSIREQFWNVVAPMHDRFVEVQKACADLVIEQPITESAFRLFVATVRALAVVSGLAPSQIGDSRTKTPELLAPQSL